MVSVGSFQDSNLLAGVVESVPRKACHLRQADFASFPTTQIVSFTVRANALPYSFSGSNIAAESIGKVSLARVNPNNSGTAFGVAAESLASFNNRGVLNWKNSQPVDLLVPEQDLVVRLLT